MMDVLSRAGIKSGISNLNNIQAGVSVPHEKIAAEESAPNRIRTGVSAVRGHRPRPLDDGSVEKNIKPAPRTAAAVRWEQS